MQPNELMRKTMWQLFKRVTPLLVGLLIFSFTMMGWYYLPTRQHTVPTLQSVHAERDMTNRRHNFQQYFLQHTDNSWMAEQLTSITDWSASESVVPWVNAPYLIENFQFDEEMYSNLKKWWISSEQTYLSTIVLWFGSVVAILVSVAIFLMQSLRNHRSAASYAVNQEAIRRQRAEQVKVLLERALLHSQKLKSIGTLAGGIAHDFNNILYAMMGYIEMVRQDLPVNSHAVKNLDKALAAGERAKKLITNILSFSRQQPQLFEPIDLCQIIHICFDLLLPTVPPTVELKQVIEVTQAPIMGSSLELEQVIINCINNALDAVNRQGKIEVNLSKTSAQEDPLATLKNLPAQDYYCIRIKDNGCGMSEETLKRLFEPFYTTKEVGKGTGLGLAMAHGVIENHRGIILANSKLGAGTTFYIFLPEHKDSDP